VKQRTVPALQVLVITGLQYLLELVELGRASMRFVS